MRIVLIGSGAVATHLAKSLFQNGHSLMQIYSRSLEHAELLAQKVGAQAISNMNELFADADLYLVVIKDDAIPDLIASLPHQNGIWLHTAGSVSMNALKHLTDNVGVMYPLQTFSKAKEVDFKQIPICIEANSEKVFVQLKALAMSISNKVFEMSEQQRGILHISAIFACNFVNFMYSNAQEILEMNQIPFEIIRPLILETAEKALAHLPKEVQTGPAVRHDVQTQHKHINLLANQSTLLNIYKNLSQQIVEMYK